MVGAVGRDLHHKPVTAELAHQRGVFAHWIQYDNAVIGGEEHVHKLPFPGEALPGARHAKIQSVRVFQLLPVCHDDIVGKGVQAVIDRLPVHAQLLGHKGHEDSRGAGGHAPLYLYAVEAEREA